MKKFRKSVVSIIIVLCLLFTLAVPAFAAVDNQKSDYPFIFVHGMLGWGEDSPTEKAINYWGFIGKTDAMDHLRANGEEVYFPNLGSLSSNWDRCCELFAQLTGTRVDYGEAHAAKHGHARYGRDYSGKPCMGEAWDLNSKLNLVGHSLGGTTIRMFTSLLAYGDAEEQAASGSDCSELFKGGHDDVINAVVTLAAPHNGTLIANVVRDQYAPALMLVMLENFLSSAKFPLSDTNLDQWGLSNANGITIMNIAKCMKFVSSKDNSLYDCTIGGAREFNENVKCVDNTYYISYTAQGVAWSHSFLGYVACKTMFLPFRVFLPLFKICDGKVIDGVKMQGDWLISDGLVPVISAKYPLGEDAVRFNAAMAGGKLERGKWMYHETMELTDHFDFCRATGTFGGEANYYEFFDNLTAEVNSLPA